MWTLFVKCVNEADIWFDDYDHATTLVRFQKTELFPARSQMAISSHLHVCTEKSFFTDN